MRPVPAAISTAAIVLGFCVWIACLSYTLAATPRDSAPWWAVVVSLSPFLLMVLGFVVLLIMSMYDYFRD